MYIIAPPHGPLRLTLPMRTLIPELMEGRLLEQKQPQSPRAPLLSPLTPDLPTGSRSCCKAVGSGCRVADLEEEMLGPLRAPPSGAAPTPPATGLPLCPADSPRSGGSLPSAKGTSWGGAQLCALDGPGGLSPYCPRQGQREDSGEPCAPVIVGVLFMTLYVLQRKCPSHSTQVGINQGERPGQAGPRGRGCRSTRRTAHGSPQSCTCGASRPPSARVPQRPAFSCDAGGLGKTPPQTKVSPEKARGASGRGR